MTDRRTQTWRPVLVPLLVAMLVVAACSGDDDDATDVTATSTTVTAETSATDVPATTPAPSASASISAPDDTEATDAPSTGPTSTDATTTTILVPETGVPGLTSEDAFCAAWSRYAGSYQVIAVAAAFGTGSPEDLAVLEVLASPTVVAASDELFANWPEELESEREVAADDYFGPFVRRLEVARDALFSAGADEASIAAIDDLWVAALADRNQDDPDFAVDLPDEFEVLTDTAAADFSAQLVAFSADPSLVTVADTPLLDEYLVSRCPDQGTLGGQEVDGG